MILFVWLAAALAALYLYCRQIYSRFSKHGVKTQPPVPLLGDMAGAVFRKKHLMEIVTESYNEYPNERFIGRFEFIRPIVLIRDLELVKRLAVKDYEIFLDHGLSGNKDLDPLFGRALFTLKGQKWKDMRSTLSPVFTSSKIRHMVPFMMEVGDQMIVSLKKKIKESGRGYIDVECKDIATKYTNDVIASCAFGLRVDSYSDPDNEFYRMGYKAADFKFWQLMVFFGHSAFPRIFKALGLSLFPKDTTTFFSRLMTETMMDREEKGILRPDMIHLLMEAKKGRLAHDVNSGKDADAGFATVEESEVGKKFVNRAWEDIDLTAQAFIFFLAGFETVSTGMTFLLYELALNPEVQDKLAREIRENNEKTGGKFDYSSIQSMTYLDMVVSELLRKWPPAIATDRSCNKDYNLGKPNDEATSDYIIKTGENIYIPIVAIHYDPKYHPDPLKFDPERFSDKNKKNIKDFSYMPFGVGPRNCIGSRFALCEIKVMIYQLLLHIEVSPCEKTPIPARLSKNTFNLRLIGGQIVRMKLRK